MRFLAAVMLLMSLVVVIGCGGGQVATPEATPSSVVSLIKPVLEKIASTGDRETVGELKSYIEEDLAGVDKAKSDALLADYNELVKLTDPAQIKAKAQGMLSKL